MVCFKNNFNKKISKIYLTASGGSLLNIKISKFNKLGINEILKHLIGTWEKITVDSSTLMNKVFEVIEAKIYLILNISSLNNCASTINYSCYYSI